jgi:hypothetical protein
MTKQTNKKTVNVLYTYKFNHIKRICFTVLSANEKDQYNTCFDGDAEHGSCTCRGGDFHHCYHLDQLKTRAAEYFASRQPAQPEVVEDDFSDLVDPDIDATQKVDAVAEAQAFIARAQAEKTARAEKLARGKALMESGKASVWGYSGLHNAVESKIEIAPSGRLVPMR